MATEKQISIIALHGNGGGGFRFDLAKPLFPENINFKTPTLPGFNSIGTLPSNYSMKNYAEWIENYLKDIKSWVSCTTGVSPAIATIVNSSGSLWL